MTISLLEAVQRLIAAAKVAQRDRALAPVERRLKRQMSAAFRAHQRVFLAEFARFGPQILGEAAPLPQIEGALETAYQATNDLFMGPIEEAAAASMEAAYAHRAAEFGLNLRFDLKNPRAVDAIQKRGAAAVAKIDETTRSRLSEILTKGMEEGFDYKKVARQIVAEYDAFGGSVKAAKHIRNRAELIAINEAAEAYEEGNRLVVDEMVGAGLEMEKSWSTVGDVRVSDGCRQNAAAGWIPADQPFPSGHQHAPRFPGCRCAILYRRRPTPTQQTV